MNLLFFFLWLSAQFSVGIIFYSTFTAPFVERLKKIHSRFSYSSLSDSSYFSRSLSSLTKDDHKLLILFISVIVCFAFVPFLLYVYSWLEFCFLFNLHWSQFILLNFSLIYEVVVIFTHICLCLNITFRVFNHSFIFPLLCFVLYFSPF